MYTYMSICIYIKEKNTVCHIWFMCNTFRGCLILVVSSTFLCWGIAHVRCYWSCLPWIVAWSWRKGWCYQHISHLLSYLSPSLSIQDTPTVTDTDAYKWLSALPAIFFQQPLPGGCQLVWLTASDPLSRSLHPGLFLPSTHTHQCHYSSMCIRSCTSFSSSRFSFAEWFVSSVPLNGMCLFSAFSANLDVDATLEKTKQNKEKKKQKTKKHFPKLWRVGDFWGWAQQ